MADFINFSGKKIIVVGASSGIGQETAIRLSELGAQLILVARREENLKATMNVLSGVGHVYYIADLNEVEKIEALVGLIVKEQGKLDGLVYAAGITEDIPLTQLKPEKVKNIFKINFFAFVEMVRQVCKKGRFNKGMRIVAISSMAAFKGDKAKTAYAASKSALDGAIKCIAKEIAGKGICINSVAPGMVRTEMYEKYLQRYNEDSDTNRGLLERQYLGIIEPEAVANAIIFLLSPESQFITGIALPVSGGNL